MARNNLIKSLADKSRQGIVVHDGPVEEFDPAQVIGGKSGTLRAAIFGMNDGLVSNLSLIMGVAGASANNHFIIVAGLAGLLAGAFSMGAFLTRFTGRPPWLSGARMLAVGAIAAGITFGIGSLFHVSTS